MMTKLLVAVTALAAWCGVSRAAEERWQCQFVDSITKNEYALAYWISPDRAVEFFVAPHPAFRPLKVVYDDAAIFAAIRAWTEDGDGKVVTIALNRNTKIVAISLTGTNDKYADETPSRGVCHKDQ